jgi:hypothetical protein
MKNIVRFVLVMMAVLLVASAAYAGQVPKSDIQGSAHDFKADYKGASYSMCNYCHIAHKFGSAPTGPGYLLWNHTLSTTASYGVYTSDSMQVTPDDLGGQMTVSNLCLSCHDGTVAVNSWYESPSYLYTGPVTDMMPDAMTVRDLTKQHPVNFTYPDATTASNIGILVAADTKSIDGSGTIPLFAGKMQCATCHDPHAGKAPIFERPFPQTAAVVATGTFCVYCHQ